MSDDHASTAVVVFHGMGQQVPFQTLGDVACQVARAVVGEDGSKSGTPELSVEIVAAKGRCNEFLPRARLQPPQNSKFRCVDFYECYWAPITEGKVGLVDALEFLWSGGLAGLRFSLQGKLTRWFWRGKAAFPVSGVRTFISLALALAVILSLCISALALILILGSHAIRYIGFADIVGKFKDAECILVFLLQLILISAPLIILGMLKPDKRKGRKSENEGVMLRILQVAALIIGLGMWGYHFLAAVGAVWAIPSLSRPEFLATGITDIQGLVLVLFVPAILLVAGGVHLARIFIRAVRGFSKESRIPKPDPSFRTGLVIIVWIAIGLALASVSLRLIPMLWYGAKTPSTAQSEESIGIEYPAPATERSWIAEEAVLRFFKAAKVGASALSANEAACFRVMRRLLLFLYGGTGIMLLGFIRKFLIQYAGDVAAYISSHKVSKFDEVRDRIQDQAFKIACHVFQTTQYTRVIFMGHSLGSVIAYDTLNRCINAGLANGNAWNAERVKLLLTFGSPLNKLAFIFRGQVKDNPIRERLAAAKQPLLEETHAFRPVRWVNVWSPYDIISGSLDLFDVGKAERIEMKPDNGGYVFKYRTPIPDAVPSEVVAPNATPNKTRLSPVLALEDEEADIPLAAHTQYWKNGLIYRVLLQALRNGSDDEELLRYFTVVKEEGGGGRNAPKYKGPGSSWVSPA